MVYSQVYNINRSTLQVYNIIRPSPRYIIQHGLLPVYKITMSTLQVYNIIRSIPRYIL